MRPTGFSQAVTPPCVLANAPLPWMAKIAIIAMIIPASFSIGPLALSPSRLMFLVLVPFLTINLLRGKYGKVLPVDVLVFLNILWLTISIFVNNPAEAVQFTGSTAVVVLGGYLTARASIQTAEHFASLCRFLGYVVLLSLPFALFEALTKQMIIMQLVDRLPGMNVFPRATHEQRIPGLYRAQFTFVHPIHYGFFCALVFAMVLSGLKGAISSGERWILGGAAAFCSFLSLSSAAVLTIAVQFALILWARATVNVKNRWTILITGLTVMYIILDIASNRPALIAVISRLSFNQATVQIRQRLFEFGTEQIGKTPWLGVGYNDWGLPPWMSGSIDNFWLLQALIYGMPALLALAAAFIGGTFLVARRPLQPNSPMRDLRLGWVFMMVGMNLTLATVALFSVMYSMAFFIFASGLWIIAQKQIEPEENAPQEAPAPTGTLYSRFAPKARGTGAKITPRDPDPTTPRPATRYARVLNPTSRKQG